LPQPADQHLTPGQERAQEQPAQGLPQRSVWKKSELQK
jgi:hypothetical protein